MKTAYKYILRISSLAALFCVNISTALMADDSNAPASIMSSQPVATPSDARYGPFGWLDPARRDLPTLPMVTNENGRLFMPVPVR